MKLKKGDTVTVLKGKDKGKTETIEAVFPKNNTVLVLNVNQYKRHIKGRSGTEQKSEIVTLTKPLPVGNVSFVCPKCKKKSRLGYSVVSGKKVRVCRKCEEQV